MTPAIVATTLVIYIIVLLTAAIYTSRHNTNSGYFTAGGELRWWVAAMAMMTAAMSGITLVSVPGAVAKGSLSYMQMTLGFTAGQMVIAFLLIPIFYKMRVTSLYQYLESRFGTTTHRTGAWFFTIAKIFLAALRLYVMVIVLQSMLFDHIGIAQPITSTLVVGVVWLATRRGGVRSLVWIDILKSFCLVGATIMIIHFLVGAIGWNMSELWDGLQASPYSQILFFDDSSSPLYFWKMFFAGMFTLVAMTGLDQDMMQCNLSCINYRHAQKNIVATALLQIVVIGMFLTLGLLMYKYADLKGLMLPESGDRLLPLIATDGGLPIFAGVLFVLGLVSSTFASACSSLTGLTTSATVDLMSGERLEESQLTTLRLRMHTLIAIAIAAVMMMVSSLGNESIVNVLFKFVGYAYGPILGLYAFGIFTRWQIDDRRVWIVAVGSLLISIGGEWLLKIYAGYSIGFELLIYNAMITIIGLLIIKKR
ncbi:MAG: sodium:solute symporter [Rikenellaceae bacterium]